MSNTAQYNINFSSNSGSVFPGITKGMDGVRASVEKTTKTFGDCYKSLMSVSFAAQGLSELKNSLDSLITPGASLNAQMMELSAITGVTGRGLKEIEAAARQTSRTFGTDASQNVESYKMILSQLSPEIAQNATAMKMMGENVNILSKQMGGDTVAATDVLNTSLNQFGVSMKDPIAAAKVMADMMNVMSAGAQQGSAELPQIKNALEQVGMVAKTVGLSFAETNAHIQLLDQAGKKGSEGGIALRNVLTTLSEGRFTSKFAAQGLAQAGISVDYLADSSLPLTDRLRTLRKIQGDTALMTKVFGKENMAAAIAMINSADEADELTKKIVGTNSAVEQADTIMSGYTERMNRTKEWLNDLKISFFNIAQPFLPLTQNMITAAVTAGQVFTGLNSLNAIIGSLTIKTWFNTGATVANTTAHKKGWIEKIKASYASTMLSIRLKRINLQMMTGAVLSRIQASGIRSVAIAFGQATLGAAAFQIALDALGIGLILLAITGLVMGLKHLWENSRKFHEILGYIGGAGKAIFHNIGVYAGRLWDYFLKPIAGFIWDLYSSVFTAVWEIVKSVFNWIGETVLNIYNVFKTVFTAIWSIIKQVFASILNFASGVWNWIRQTFSTFAGWIQEYIIDPIYSAFNGVWNWIVDLFNKVADKLTGILAPIKALIKKIFSSEGTIDVHAAGLEGADKAGNDFDKKKEEEKKNKPQEVEIVKDDSHKSIFDVSKGTVVQMPTIGGVAAKTAEKKQKAEAGSGESGNKVRSLMITKLVENLNIYNQNGTTMSKEAMVQMVKEALMTAAADFTLAEAN